LIATPVVIGTFIRIAQESGRARTTNREQGAAMDIRSPVELVGLAETDAASNAGRLDWMIGGYVRRLQIEQEFKSWVIPPAPAPAAAS
jgi:hypothetical protein